MRKGKGSTIPCSSKKGRRRREGGPFLFQQVAGRRFIT